MLLLVGLSVALRAPELAAAVDRALDVSNASAMIREAVGLASTVGALGLIRLVGAVRLRLRYGVAVAAASTAIVVLIAGAELSGVSTGRVTRLVYMGAFGLYTGIVLGLCAVLLIRVARQTDPVVRTGISLTAGGFAASATGVAVALVAIVVPRAVPSSEGWWPLIIQGGAGALLAIGSSYAELAHWTSWFRRRRACRTNRATIHRLWLYVDPIRQTMARRSPADLDTQREVVDIYDALILARHLAQEALSAQAELVAHAQGLSDATADRFVRAAELRSLVDGEDLEVGRVHQRVNVDLEPDAGPGSFDACAQRREVEELGRLVLWDASVRRTAHRATRPSPACDASDRLAA
ncbi:hypothetical protein AB0878_44830 [Amycolatopsis sp. NPDC047767]|uniref:hypothetical protein n=1 Tax=Amycolatopsis sp. NPDC047767 TaxID=3156765 RepID=UPI0034553055